jgi:hypothetical protein
VRSACPTSALLGCQAAVKLVTSEAAARASSIHVVALSDSTAFVPTAGQLATSITCGLLAAQQTSPFCVWPDAPAELPLMY